MADAISPSNAERNDVTRRWFLGWLIGGISAFIGAAVGIPYVGAVLSAVAGKKEATTIRLGKLSDFPEGQPTLAQFTVTRTDGWVQAQEGRSVWVIRNGAQDVTVYNGRCTHLGCAYNWQTKGANSDHFVCPCHDGVFAKDGSVVSGPPPRRLDTLPAKMENDNLVITFQDFRPGVPEKAPV